MHPGVRVEREAVQHGEAPAAVRGRRQLEGEGPLERVLLEGLVLVLRPGRVGVCPDPPKGLVQH